MNATKIRNPMAKVSRLFDLIKNLSTHEKRYFRLYANLQSGKKLYLKLFDAIEKQKEYDSAKLKNQFKGEKFVENLAVTQSYLCEQILRSLRNLKSSFKVEKQVMNLIEEFELLKERGLYEHADSLLKKAKKIAEQKELHQLHCILIMKEIGFVNTRSQRRTKLRNLFDESREVGFLAETELALYAFKNHFHVELLSGGIKEDQKEDLESKWKMVSKEIGDPEALSFRARKQYLEIIRLRAVAAGEKNGRYQSSKKLYELWKQNPEMKAAEPIYYLKDVGQYISSCFKLNKFSELKELFVLFRNRIPSKIFQIEAEYFKVIRVRELLYYLNTFDFDSAKETMNEIEKGFVKFDRLIQPSRRVSFFYNSSLVHTFMGAPQKASDWIDKIIDFQLKEFEPHLQRFAPFFNIVLHLDMNMKSGNFSYLESMISQIERRFKNDGSEIESEKEKPLSVFEKLILNSVRKYINAGLVERKEILLDFLHQIQDIRNAQPGLTGAEELEIWLKQKLGLDWKKHGKQ